MGFVIPRLLRATPGPTSPLVRMWCWCLHHPQGRPLPTSFPYSPLSVHQQPETLQRSTPGYVVKMKYVYISEKMCYCHPKLLLLSVDWSHFLHLKSTDKNVTYLLPSTLIDISFLLSSLPPFFNYPFSSSSPIFFLLSFSSPLAHSPHPSLLQPSLIILVSTSWQARSVHTQAKKIFSWINATKRFQ